MKYSIKVKINALTTLLCAGLLFSASLNARQVHFEKRINTTYIEYDYNFTASSGQTYKLKFRLDRRLSEASKALFTRTSKDRLIQRARQEAADLFNELQVEYIEQARDKFDTYINEQAMNLPAGISIQNKNKGKNIRVSSDGSVAKREAEPIIDEFLDAMNVKWQVLNQQYLEAFEIEIAKRTQAYYIDAYKQEYYVASFSSEDANSYSLRIDFAQVAQLHAAELKPVADAIAANTRGLTGREVLNYTAHFIQSIPYDALNSRDAHGEIGFVAPLTLFEINKGDCDTKSTALAAILHNLYPAMDIKMVLIPNHAFLAIQFEGQAEDTAISYHDKEYVVVEAAGPALTPMGKSYEASLKHMQNNPGKIGRIISLFD